MAETEDEKRAREAREAERAAEALRKTQEELAKYRAEMQHRAVIVAAGTALTGVAARVLPPTGIITVNNHPITLNQAHALCNSGIGQLGQVLSPVIAGKCGEVNNIFLLLNTVMIISFILATIIIWKGFTASPRSQPDVRPRQAGPRPDDNRGHRSRQPAAAWQRVLHSWVARRYPRRHHGRHGDQWRLRS